MSMGPFLEDFLKANDCALINGKFYLIRNEGIVLGGYLSFYGEHFPIRESLTLNEVEKLYIEKNKEWIFSEMVAQAGKMKPSNLSSQIEKSRDMELADFVLNKVIVAYKENQNAAMQDSGLAYDLAQGKKDNFGHKTQDNQNDIPFEEIIEDLCQMHLAENCFKESFLNLSDIGAFKISNNKAGNYYIEVNGTFYSIDNIRFNTGAAEKSYISKLEKKMKELLKTKISISDKLRNTEKMKQISDIAQKQSFLDADTKIGFEKTDSGTYIVLEVQPYILMEKENNGKEHFFLFNKAIVGIPISKNNGTFAPSLEAHVVSPIPYNHPGISRNLTKICIAGNMNAYSTNPAAQIVYLLKQAADHLQLGYRGQSNVYRSMLKEAIDGHYKGDFTEVNPKDYSSIKITNSGFGYY